MRECREREKKREREDDEEEEKKKKKNAGKQRMLIMSDRDRNKLTKKKQTCRNKNTKHYAQIIRFTYKNRDTLDENIDECLGLPARGDAESMGTSYWPNM